MDFELKDKRKSFDGVGGRWPLPCNGDRPAAATADSRLHCALHFAHCTLHCTARAGVYCTGLHWHTTAIYRSPNTLLPAAAAPRSSPLYSTAVENLNLAALCMHSNSPRTPLHLNRIHYLSSRCRRLAALLATGLCSRSR